MAAMAADGAAQAINLTGLTLKAEMDMALHIGQYRSATLVHCHCSSLISSLHCKMTRLCDVAGAGQPLTALHGKGQVVIYAPHLPFWAVHCPSHLLFSLLVHFAAILHLHQQIMHTPHWSQKLADSDACVLSNPGRCDWTTPKSQTRLKLAVQLWLLHCKVCAGPKVKDGAA